MPGERLAPIVMFSVIFLAFIMLIIGTMGQLFAANAMSNTDTFDKTDWSIVGGITYLMWQNSSSGSGGYNYNTTGADVTEYSNWHATGLTNLHNLIYGSYLGLDDALDSRAHFSFYDPYARELTDSRTDIFIVRNNTGYSNHLDNLYDSDVLKQSTGMRDFIFIRQYGWSGELTWGGIGQENWYGIIPYSILESTGNGTYFAKSWVGNFNVTTMIFPSAPSHNLTTDLESNHFIVQVGVDAFNVSIGGHVGMMNIISALFMFQTKDIGIPDPLGLMISIPIWIATAFAVVGIVSRFFPTIPGF
jgi:hypothetical protein